MKDRELSGLYEAYQQVQVYEPTNLTESDVLEFETWVNQLVHEGYDLSDYTLDEMYDIYSYALQENINEFDDYYDYILEHLISEGYAESVEDALNIMANLDEEYISEGISSILRKALMSTLKASTKPTIGLSARTLARQGIQRGGQLTRTFHADPQQLRAIQQARTARAPAPQPRANRYLELQTQRRSPGSMPAPSRNSGPKPLNVDRLTTKLGSLEGRIGHGDPLAQNKYSRVLDLIYHARRSPDAPFRRPSTFDPSFADPRVVVRGYGRPSMNLHWEPFPKLTPRTTRPISGTPAPAPAPAPRTTQTPAPAPSRAPRGSRPIPTTKPTATPGPTAPTRPPTTGRPSPQTTQTTPGRPSTKINFGRSRFRGRWTPAEFADKMGDFLGDLGNLK